MSRTKEHHGGVWILELLILIGLPILFHYLFPLMNVVPKPYSYLGILIMFIGLVLMTWAAREFNKANTGYQLRNSSKLVTSGPFRFSRNPIYLGMVFWLIGLAILLGSLITFLFPFFFFLIVNFTIIPSEETSLEKLFGTNFTKYKQDVRRWL